MRLHAAVADVVDVPAFWRRERKGERLGERNGRRKDWQLLLFDAALTKMEAL